MRSKLTEEVRDIIRAEIGEMEASIRGLNETLVYKRLIKDTNYDSYTIPIPKEPISIEHLDKKLDLLMSHLNLEVHTIKQETILREKETV